MLVFLSFIVMLTVQGSMVHPWAAQFSQLALPGAVYQSQSIALPGAVHPETSAAQSVANPQPSQLTLPQPPQL